MPRKIIKKGKKKRKPKKPSERWKKYKVEGDKTQRTGKFCPRCGPGIFLSEPKKKDRLYCGKCHYTEFLSKSEKEEKKEEKHKEEKK
jgi:small subunit ribosomal protein S27Ae